MWYLIEGNNYSQPETLTATRYDDACEEAVRLQELTLIYDESEGESCSRLSALVLTLEENDYEVLDATGLAEREIDD